MISCDERGGKEEGRRTYTMLESCSVIQSVGILVRCNLEGEWTFVVPDWEDERVLV